MASCPARLNRAGTCRRPVSSIPARTTSCSRVSHMTAGASCSSRADQVSPRRPAISSSSRVMLPQTRSRSSSCSPRRSTVSRASPGTTLTAPGNVSSRPTVAMMWCSARPSRSTASAASLAPSRASCRVSYRAPPACRASPSICTANRRAPAIEVTTPSGRAAVVELRALLDVRLEVPGQAPGRGRPRRCARGRARTRGTPCAAWCRLVGQVPPRLVPAPGHRGRPEQGGAEPGALLVPERHDLERERQVPRRAAARGRPRSP